ncbi:MAG: acetone carboxylase subunit gamma [Archaeoglobaceae archaeon]
MKTIEAKIREIERLLENKADEKELFAVIAGEKDPEISFDAITEYFQRKLGWKEKILMPLSKHLFIVCKDRKAIVKAACGHEFGDYRVNWKIFAKVSVRRNREEMQDLYPYFMHADAGWCEIREYICPGCGKLLSVEVVPPGYPPVFEFLPDLVTFYEKWLGREFPCEKVETKDLTVEELRKRFKI